MDEVKPWTTLATTTIHKDSWIDLKADRCRKADGTLIEPYYVLHYPNWVHVLALLPDDRIVMVRQYRHAAKIIAHELPGGMMDPTDPSSEVTARRELLEETGYRAGALAYVGAHSPNPASHTNQIITYWTRDAAKIAEPKLESGETLSVVLMPVADVLAGLTTGIVAQSTQISCLLLGLRAAGRISF
jgi:8-oxo-dGTP pyrophosphatase MutT (NUDIX family)